MAVELGNVRAAAAQALRSGAFEKHQARCLWADGCKKKKKKELEQTSMNSWSVHSADLKLPKSFDISDNP